MMKQLLLRLIMSVLRPLLPSTNSFSRFPSNHPLLDKPACIYFKILKSMVMHQLPDRLDVSGTKYFSFSFIYVGRLHVSAFLSCTLPGAYYYFPRVRVIRFCRLISFRDASAFSCLGQLIISVYSLMCSIGFPAHHPTYLGSTS
jgi:hypothetical protein